MFPDYNERAADNEEPFFKFHKPGEAAATIKFEAAGAAKLLNDLADPDIGREKHEPGAVLPASAIVSAKGVAVSSSTKIGLVGTYTTGSGFVVSRLPDNSWSAPLFFNTHCVGVGLSLGFSEVQTVLCLPSTEATWKLATNDLKWGSDLSVRNHHNARAGTVQAAIGSDVRKVQMDEDMAVAFSISSGGIVDLSMQGWKTSPDSQKNSQLYGPEARAKDILAGEVQPPGQFEEFYKALRQLEGKAVCSAP